jgi:flagellar hook-associated protein 2
MSIRTDGIISGIKTSALISELSASISRPKILLENKVTKIGLRQTAYSTLNTKLKAVETSLEAIKDLEDFRSFTPTVPSTAEDYFSVTTTGDATAGTYSIQTTNLAESERWVLNSFTDNDSDAPIKDGTFNITWDSTTSSGYSNISVTVNSTNGNNTLSTLSSQLDSKSGISSYVMFDGSTYRLVVQGEDTGSKYAFSVGYTGSGTSGTAFTPSTNTSIQEAENATLSLNGITVSSSDNTFSDAVEGMTITATGEMDDASITAKDVTVALDVTAVTAKVQGFVTAYNDVVSFVSANSKFDKDNPANKGIFVGDSSSRGIMNRIRSVISTQYSSLQTANSSDVVLDSLSVMGITFSTDNDGTLTLDGDTLTSAIQDKQLEVEAMFGEDANSFSTAMLSSLDEYVDPLTGIIKIR